MMLPFFSLLLLMLPWVDVAAQPTEADTVTNTTGVLPWTFNVKCHRCLTKNTFNCPNLATCPYETRRCLIIASRLNSRELLVYKDCTWNCTFVYAAHQPPPTPKYAPKTNSFYFVLCCSGMTCNAGGPVNVERDMLPEPTFEEEPVEGTVCLDTSKFLLSLAFFLFSSTLT